MTWLERYADYLRMLGTCGQCHFFRETRDSRYCSKQHRFAWPSDSSCVDFEVNTKTCYNCLHFKKLDAQRDGTMVCHPGYHASISGDPTCCDRWIRI